MNSGCCITQRGLSLASRSMSDEALTSAQSDHALIAAALAGDLQARNRLSKRLEVVRRILAVINARAGSSLSSHELEDLSQDVSIVVWEKLRLFEGVGTLESWLYRFCAYGFQNHRRRVSRRARNVKSLPDEQPGPSPEVDFSDLEDALRELGPPSEPVIRLKHEDGMSFEEIAATLGVPASTAKTRYYDGIRWLRQRLSRGEGGRA